MSKLLSTQRRACLAIVTVDDRTRIDPLPLGWRAVQLILGAVALWWLVQVVVVEVGEAMTALVVRVEVMSILLSVIAGELWQSVSNSRIGQASTTPSRL